MLNSTADLRKVFPGTPISRPTIVSLIAVLTVV
jgi:hypothetical protein